MTQGARSFIPTGRRCSNCGSRVAQNAETCYFCGHELTEGSRSRPARLNLRDAVLALALLAVVVGWWQFGSLGVNIPFPNDSQVETRVTPLQAAGAQPTTGTDGQQPGPSVGRHTVQSGETLLGIAGRYGVTVEDIQAANNLTGTLIRAGDVLLIPIPASISENGGSNNAPTISTVFSYIVRPGDTVISIAIRFGTTVAAIQEANGIGPNDIIRPDQELQLPVSGVPSTILATSQSTPARQNPNSGEMYLPLQLLGPDDSDSIPHSEDVLFRWLSGGLLEENEWYVLYIWPLEGLFELPPPVWTKATSYRLPSQWAPPPDRDVTYRWQTSVVRVLTGPEGERSIEGASSPGEVRSFIWSGGDG